MAICATNVQLCMQQCSGARHCASASSSLRSGKYVDGPSYTSTRARARVRVCARALVCACARGCVRRCVRAQHADITSDHIRLAGWPAPSGQQRRSPSRRRWPRSQAAPIDAPAIPVVPAQWGSIRVRRRASVPVGDAAVIHHTTLRRGSPRKHAAANIQCLLADPSLTRAHRHPSIPAEHTRLRSRAPTGAHSAQRQYIVATQQWRRSVPCAAQRGRSIRPSAARSGRGSAAQRRCAHRQSRAPTQPRANHCTVSTHVVPNREPITVL